MSVTVATNRASPARADRAVHATRLAFADGLRGLAAFWVVLFHASEGHHVDRLKAALPLIVDRAVFELGYLGVPIFFVLSGFVMAYTVQGVVADRRFAGRFVLRRLIRLTPPYWASIALVLALLALKRFATHAPDVHWPSPGELLANATYLQGIVDARPLNNVYWTLGIEVQFYVAFAVLLLLVERWAAGPGRDRARLAVFGLTGALCLLWPAGIVENPVWQGGFIPFWYSFATGAFVCWAIGRRAAVAPAAALIAAMALVSVVGRSPFAATSACTAAALLVAGRAGRMGNWLRWRWLQFLGLVSYSLYLVHNPITGAGFNVVRRVLPEGLANELVGLAASIAICLAVAYAAFRWVEVPSQRWSHAVRLGRRHPPG